ncbi:ArsR family transcriptional regulator [Leucobacter coleopterorum]|uniref:ArsR family transcriptional regulator n=1 Tax=Leucobacter coleopterorum TaxID=2714933 RepID=A0ABX6JX97_9MICO|nr:helix-turn-helix domain-containing protein [Leucobacter coleopterorum]QIM18873.1 ArsR family transcriptional regulator [Leucobacter coleopterorum]
MSTYRTLSSLSRVQLLFVLQQRGEKTAGELAAEVNLHHNTVHEHLQRLVEDGFVLAHSEERRIRGRPKVFYSARIGHEDLDEIGERKLASAQNRADMFKRIVMGQHIEDSLAESSDEAIRTQLEILEDHLDQVGFDPETDHPNLEVNLFSCPFKSMVAEHQDMVCSVHLGLINMMLAITEGPLRADQLHPFVTPGSANCILCRLRDHRSRFRYRFQNCEPNRTCVDQPPM